MAPSLYEAHPASVDHVIRRGQIYRFRPVVWLKPPLWIVRNIQWGSPTWANLCRQVDLSDSFRRADDGNEEDVVARAKVRGVVVLSNDTEAASPKLKEIIVAPTYTITSEKPKQEFIDRLRAGAVPGCFYLPRDAAFPDTVECYLDLRKVQPLHKEFLLSQYRLPVRLTANAVAAILDRYKTYLYM